MAGIGIVNNPRSRRNLRLPDTGERLRRLVDGEGEVLDAATHEELAHALDTFDARGVDVLGINGGDGTGHVVLTALARRSGDRPLPAVLLLRGGAMNTVAHGHRLRGTPESIVQRHLERRRAGIPPRLVARDLLRVDAPGAPPSYGFIFGTGAVVAFLDAYYGSGRPSPAMAAALLARLVPSAAVGGKFAARITAREPLRVRADGEEWPDDRYLSVLAATVPEIGFGFTPFPRCDEQPGFFHAVGVTGTAAQLVPRLPAIYVGRPWRRPLALEAVARDLLVEGPGPVRFTLDGDLYASPREVRVSTGPAVQLLLG
jgi:diacylglycerol kinase family enzyme